MTYRIFWYTVYSVFTTWACSGTTGITTSTPWRPTISAPILTFCISEPVVLSSSSVMPSVDDVRNVEGSFSRCFCGSLAHVFLRTSLSDLCLTICCSYASGGGCGGKSFTHCCTTPAAFAALISVWGCYVCSVSWYSGTHPPPLDQSGGMSLADLE